MDSSIRENKSIYNMEKILTSVDYFSQLLSLEQILSYGYEFFHNTLGLRASAIYFLDEDIYKLVGQIGYINKIDFKYHKKSNKINKVATLYGRILYENFYKYFEEEFIDHYDPELIIPLIVKDELYGFIIADGFACEENPYSSLYSIEYLEGMKTLLNMALSNTLLYRDYKKLAKNMDKELFQQFSINQTTKMLLAETDINKLYDLCIDVVRELTSSSVTSLAIFDSIRKKFIIKGYSDIINFRNYYDEFELIIDEVPSKKSVFDIEDDFEELSLIFKKTEDLRKIPAKYLILIGDKPITGFITVGDSVSGSTYDNSTLNQIQNVGKTIYLALKNAKYVEEIKERENETAIQLKNLKKLNSMIRNINSCEDLDELLEIILKTLDIGYKVKQAAIILKNEKNIERINSFGYTSSSIVLNESILENNYNEIFFSHNINRIDDFIDISISDKVESNCMLLLPIKTDYIDISKESILGYIIITQLEGILEENHIVIFETLTSSVTPLIKQFIELERLKNKKI